MAAKSTTKAIPSDVLKAAAAGFKAAGTSATPIGTAGNTSQPFKVAGKQYASVRDLALRGGAVFGKLTADQLVKANPGMTATRAGSLMAHRARILKAAGIN